MASSRSAVATKADIDSLRTEIKKDLARFATKDDFRGLAVMVERLESTVRGLAEGVVATREQLERRIDEGDSRLERRPSSSKTSCARARENNPTT